MPHHAVHLVDGEKLPLTRPEQLVHWPPGKPPGGKLPEPIPGCERLVCPVEQDFPEAGLILGSCPEALTRYRFR